MSQAYPIIVRRATPADAAAIAALSRQVMVATFVGEFKIAYEPAELEAFLDKYHGEPAMLARINNPDVEVWVAEADGVLAGYASAGPMSLPHPDIQPGDRELYRLYVEHAFHGAGAGAALMDRVVENVQWLGVWSGNLRAQRFYHRYGFEKAGEYDYIVGSTVDQEFIFHRPRSPCRPGDRAIASSTITRGQP